MNAGAGRSVARIVRRVALGLGGLAVVILAILLQIDNAEPVTVRFLTFVSPAWPLFWWLLAAFLAGLATGLVCCSFGFVRGKLTERRLRRSLPEN